ncbi:YveK family protein [Alteribacillus bidgolensis]|uniref:Capsular polysaccharide biosynthesis protein n=1 Tax=Alteribacillus bidgolensis TaxID=930129 RepID=A0A1G8PPL3_9BACI|nr:Wzz/FepE/Etk N-terminal domain-containing protein [Alteribacillus bidgolensis]SDI94479.1 Capsular polysaccharide biosynthesis protein [Alteribacillus bidgolensis]
MEETISLKEILDVLKKRMLLIISITIGAVFVSAMVTFFLLTPTYESSSQFIVNQSDTQEPNGIYEGNDIQTNVELINTYNVIIKSPAILSEVIEEHGFNLTPEKLAKKIQVSNEENSQVVTVTVTDENPHVAADMANATVETFQAEIPSLMNVDNVNILSPAAVAADVSPVSPQPALNIAIAFVVGLMAGVGLAFLLEFLDNTIKTEDDIEHSLGLPVMGSISTIKESDVPARGRVPKAQVSEVRRKSVGS